MTAQEKANTAPGPGPTGHQNENNETSSRRSGKVEAEGAKSGTGRAAEKRKGMAISGIHEAYSSPRNMSTETTNKDRLMKTTSPAGANTCWHYSSQGITLTHPIRSESRVSVPASPYPQRFKQIVGRDDVSHTNERPSKKTGAADRDPLPQKSRH